MTLDQASRSETPRQVAAGEPVWLLALIVAYFLGLRLWFDIAVYPSGDEAYYWMWGQHLDWSYFDHPPLNAWLQSIIARVFGWSAFSVRIVTWASLLGTFGVLWAMARLVSRDRPSAYFWKTATIFFTLPITFLLTTPAFNDHLLIFLALASIYFFLTFVIDREAGGSSVRGLYLAGVFLGLATLSKYNGALLGLGYVAFVIARPRLRGLLRTPHPYVAVAIATALQAPVIYWNLTQGLASLTFHITERPSSRWLHPSPYKAGEFLLLIAAAIGPILYLSLPRLALLKDRALVEEQLRGLTTTIFLVSTTCVTIVALFTDVLLHWNIVAYLGLLLVGYRLLDRWWLFWSHVAVALYLATGAVWNYAVAPVDLGIFKDPRTGANYGWSEVAATVGAQQKAHPGAFVATTDYTYAAQLGFAMHDPEVTAFGELPSQYDLWWRADVHQGQTAIIVADRTANIASAGQYFRSVTKLADVPVLRQGRTVWTFEIYLGEGYGNHVAN